MNLITYTWDNSPSTMFICFSKGIGNYIACDYKLNDCKYVELDGHTISREDYPEFFKAINSPYEKVKLADLNNNPIYKEKVYFYLIVND